MPLSKEANLLSNLVIEGSGSTHEKARVMLAGLPGLTVAAILLEAIYSVDATCGEREWGYFGDSFGVFERGEAHVVD